MTTVETELEGDMGQSPRVRLTVRGTGAAAAILIAVLIGSTPTARGQHALDANLSATRGRINPPKKVAILDRIGEAIVTGTATGGRAFRDDSLFGVAQKFDVQLGFRASGDFRENLGSNDLYRFRADSYTSGLVLHGMDPLRGRGVTGWTMPTMPGQPNRGSGGGRAGRAGAFEVERSGGGSDLARIAQWRYSSGYRAMDPSGSLQSLQDFRLSTDAYSEWYRSNLSLATTAAALSAPSRANAAGSGGSGGISRNQMASTAINLGAAGSSGNPYVAPAFPDGATFDASLSTWLSPGSTGSDASAGSTPGLPSTIVPGSEPYLDVLARLAAPGAAPGGSGTPAYSGDVVKAMYDLNERLRRAGIEPAKPVSEAVGVESDGAGGGRVMPVPVGQLKVELPVVSTLAGSGTSRFDGLMQKAQADLVEGRYFDAERRYDLALAFVPGHPMAQVGRVHAQLGAGLYLSAAQNLRLLLQSHLELMGVRFDGAMLPTAARMPGLIEHLAGLMRRNDWPDAGLLLAYVGYQTGDVALIEAGLADLDQDRPGDGLAAAVREVWQRGR